MLDSLQIRLQIAQRAGHVVQVIREQSAIAQLAQRRRRQRQQQLGDVARLRKRAHVDVDALQVEQHPHDDLLPRGRRQQRSAERDLAADVLLQQQPAVVLRQQRAGVERIDDQSCAELRLAGSARGSGRGN